MIKNKRGGFDLSKFVIGILIFGLFVMFGVMYITDINNNYGKSISTSDFGEVYNTSNDMYNLQSDMKNLTLDGDISTTDSTESMIRGSYSAVRLIGGTFAITDQIIQAIAKKLQIPQMFVTAAIIGMTLTIIFAFIFMFLLRLKS